MPRSTAWDEPWTIPTGLEISSRPVAGDEPAEGAADLLRHDASDADRLPGRLDRAERLAAGARSRAGTPPSTPRSHRARASTDSPSRTTIDRQLARRRSPGSRSAISLGGSIACPSIATIRSPGLEARAARRASSGTTSSTVRVARPPPTMKSAAKRTTRTGGSRPGRRRSRRRASTSARASTRRARARRRAP